MLRLGVHSSKETEMHPLRTYLLLGALATASTHASADLIAIDTYLTGGYSSDGSYGNSIPGQNYRVGHSPVTTVAERRNFFLFDLTPFAPKPPGSVIGGFLKVYVPKFAPGITIDPGDGYISEDPFEDYVLTSTPFTADEIADPTNTVAEALAIYASLGTGSMVGAHSFHPGDKGMEIMIPLSPPALAAINSLLGTGKVAMGGRLTSLDFLHPDELVFGFTDLIAPHMEHKTPSLVLDIVPAPGPFVVFGFAAIGAGRRRRT